MTFKILLILFAVFVLLRTFGQYRARKVTAGWFVTWTIFWVMVVVVAFIPQFTDVIAVKLGVGRGADLIIYISLAALFYSLFRLVLRQDQLNRDLTELVRKLAIDEKKKDV